MTMPNERYDALIRTKKLLEELLQNDEPMSASELRQKAYRCVKHFPWDLHINDLAESRPDILERREK